MPNLKDAVLVIMIVKCSTFNMMHLLKRVSIHDIPFRTKQVVCVIIVEALESGAS